jgi:prevent-host-death family protein
MKKVAAGSFKTHCLSLMDDVQAKRETIVITKRGRPIAKLVPIENQVDDFYGFFVGKGEIVGDIISPALSLKEWGNLG